jgi:hypothetical protein
MPGSAEILNCDGVSVGYVRVDGKGQQRYRRDRATGKDRVPASQGCNANLVVVHLSAAQNASATPEIQR